MFIFYIFGYCICPSVCKYLVPMHFALWGCASLQCYSIEAEVETGICVICEKTVKSLKCSAVAHKRWDNICFAYTEVYV